MAASPIPPPAPQRARGSLADLVVNYVREQVASHALKPGDQLPTETALMSLLGVSRTVVREANSRLQASAVIETRHGIGSFVLEPRHQPLGLDVVPATTLSDLLSVLELRISLETECAGLAAQRAKEQDIANIRTALDAIEEMNRAGGDSTAADLRFYFSVARATGNALLLRTLIGVQTLATRFWVAAMGEQSQEEQLADVALHRDLAAAIARRDPEAAEAAMARLIGDPPSLYPPAPAAACREGMTKD